MNSEEEDKRPPAGDTPAPADRAPRTGEGAATALEALIRKRRAAGTPDAPDSVPPAPLP